MLNKPLNESYQSPSSLGKPTPNPFPRAIIASCAFVPPPPNSSLSSEAAAIPPYE